MNESRSYSTLPFSSLKETTQVLAVLFLALRILLPEALAEDSSPADFLNGIVKITAKNQLMGSSQQGSGIIVQIDQDGVVILTAAHVVAGDPKPQIEFFQHAGKVHESNVMPGSELSNAEDGLALLRVEPSGRLPLTIKVLPIAAGSNEIISGESVFVLSLPRVLNEWTVLKGNFVGRKGRELVVDVRGGEGSSGGAVIREAQVQVIGVVQALDQFLRGNSAQSVRAFLGGMGIHAPVKTFPPTFMGADGAPMLLIPSGNFVMRLAETDWQNVPQPEFQVYLDAYYMDQFEVTTARYQKFLEKTEHPPPDDYYWKVGGLLGIGETTAAERYPNHAVTGITWAGADAYCRWVGKRLPSEAEWVKAARGTDRRLNPWGNESPSREVANTPESRKHSQTWLGRVMGHDADDWYKNIMPVGSYHGGKSPYGIDDLAGNVREWTADWSGEVEYSPGLVKNPKGPLEGFKRIVRGTSYNSPDFEGRSIGFSFAESPDSAWIDNGFRCAKDAP